MSKKEFTEEDIVYALYLNSIEKKHRGAMGNSTKVLGYTGESDYLALTNKGYIEETEIKTDHWDFERDFKDRGNKMRRHEVLSELGDLPMMQKKMPNQFYFACPRDVIKLEEVPEYAGLIYVDYSTKLVHGHKQLKTIVVKKAPILHTMICSERRKSRFVDEMMFRGMTYSRNMFRARRKK
jgi:hypothetical protein